MTDLTPTFTQLVHSKSPTSKLSTGYMTTEIADEFLKEAYRINSHITSLLSYLQTIRPSYLSLTNTKPPTTTTTQPKQNKQPEILDDSARDTITTTTSTLLSNLSTSITTLSAAENLRQETVSRSIAQRFGKGFLAKWAGGATLTSSPGGENEGKDKEQVIKEEKEKLLKGVRESVLFYLNAKLGMVVNEQRDMVEKRIERVRERERSVLYKNTSPGGNGGGWGRVDGEWRGDTGVGTGGVVKMDEEEVKEIEKQLTPQQLQLFEEENDSLVRYFEDVVGKVQNAEKSLLEISSLQQTLVSHLSTQEEYISQLVTDASNTEANIGQGNKELKRATERRSTAQAVFWGTVGLCTWLVVWDLVF
ncbi:putative SNARE protein (Ufe1) [Aspergillus vadensis CBS 113365]|uniref:Snare protein n=1 Tax=Aspergillus vadensis (strain CBS 113365 / IMI 142717 / IBT 24658) TaxID=1448311 RepID=A0A319BG35_ASPVC|nr:snare protein [Aspergillus vadensis CBS 113365]PYH72136.1 snare protein [Aspergillus vadensis CBS 113365]